MPAKSKLHIGKYVFSIYLICLLSASVSAQDPSQYSGGYNPTTAKNQSNNSSYTPPTTDIEGAVEYQSADSLIIDFRNGRNATLFGSAKVAHTSGTLSSGKIDLNLKTNVVEASSSTPEDSLTLPVLTTPSDEIKSSRILFNFKTNKGKFEAAIVNVGEGQLIGSKVKNINEDEGFIEDGIYSTCPPDYLYYYIKAKKMKVVDEDEIFFTNARLYILDIPYPLVFPFGYVPAGGFEKKKSGLLTPTYVFDEQATRGIGLNNLGWFQYINDYITTTLRTDIYTSGTFLLSSTTQYRNSDRYNGSVSIGYSRDQGLEPTDPNFVTAVNKSLGIQHRQTISPFASVSANINLRTADFLNQNSYDAEERAKTSSTSRIAYNYKHPENLFNLGTNLSLTQNFFNNTTRLDGPSATFSLKTFSPFQNNSGNSGSPKWYESISFRYSNTLNTRFNYEPIDADSAEIGFLDALSDPALYREATGDNDYIKLGFQQKAGVTIGKILNSQYINSALSFNMNEYWFPTSIRKTFNADSNRVETEKVNGFVTARDFTSSFSLSTRIYGISNMQLGNMKGLRHTFAPSISFGYRPDFSSDYWGYYRTVQTDTLGNTRQYSIFENEIYSGPGRGEQRAISFSINNVLETKIVKRDTTGEVSEKNLKLIENLSLNASYNFAADSLNLSQLSTSFRSSSIKGINLNVKANFSFYERDDNGNFINNYLWNTGDKLAQLERFSFTASTSFRGGNGRIQTFTPKYRREYDPFNQAIFNPIDPGFGYKPVAPLNSPWSFSLNFSYTWNYRHNQKANKSAEVRASSISFNLTPKWQFSTSLGYDFIQKELTPTQFSLNRNLECWNLSFQISPFGENQYYFFSLRLNSSQIQSLFQKLPILKNLERSSSTTGRGRTGYGY